MLAYFKKKQGLKESVLFVLSIIMAQPMLGMIMEQQEYTVTSNAGDIKVSFGGQTIKIKKSLKNIQVAAPFSATVDLVFPENKEKTYSVLRTDLPGDLIIQIVRFAKGQYIIMLSSNETDAQSVVHIDIQ